ncbi:MAG: Ig-like domain-containing protein, partial [Pseudomonadota bacterium]
GTPVDIEFFNNLLWSELGNLVELNASAAAVFESDHNLFYRGTNGAAITGEIAGTQFATLAAYRGATGTDANSLEGDPDFRDIDGADNEFGGPDTAVGGGRDDNFNLRANSPAIDRGNAFEAPFEDLLGNPRSDDPSTPNGGEGFELWVETASGGSVLPGGVGQGQNFTLNTITRTLPFTFTFYGEDYTEVRISTEGFVTFGNAPTTSVASLDALLNDVIIAPFWANLSTGGGANDIFIEETATSYAIRWRAFEQGSNPQNPVEFALTLNADGTFVFDYGAGNAGLDPVIGVSAGNGRTFVLSANNGATDLGGADRQVWTPTEGLSFFDIGALEFQGNSGDVTPPTVTSVSNLPANNGTTALAFTAISVDFSESLDQVSARSPANFQLVEAGVDGTFDTIDDIVIAVTPLYSFPETDLTIVLDDGVLADGFYRLTLSGTLAIFDTAGNPLDGDADGVGGDDFQRIFTIDRSTNTAPVATPQSVSVNEDGTVTITLAGTDADADPLTFSLTSSPMRGSLENFDPVARTVVYRPDADVFGSDDFSFTVDDGKLGTDSATVTITINPVNDLPVAGDLSVNATVGVAQPIALSGFDLETPGPNLTFQIVDQPTLGTVVLTPTGAEYTATSAGADSFTYRVFDDNVPPGQSTLATVTITNSVVDTPPTATVSGLANAAEGVSYTLTVDSYVDAEGDLPTAFVIDWGDGSALETVSNPNVAGPVAIPHIFVDGDAAALVRVFADSSFGRTLLGSVNVSVADTAPTASPSLPASVDEGSTVTLTLGAITDPGDDTVTEIRVDWNGVLRTYAPGETITFSFPDDGTALPVTVSVVNEDGTFQVAALTIDVLNVAPTTAATGPDFGEVGVLYSVGIDPVVDPGDDALALTINWGDSTSSTFGAGSIPTSATHLYAQPGDYTITFDGTDEDGTYLTLATKTITVLPQAVTLTDDVDRFITTGTLRDRVFGLDGSDAILTAGGNDILVGGAGGDRLQAGDGDDILVGGLGPDVLNLGAGTDTVVVSTADFDGTFTADFIEDYVPGEDRIQIIGFGFTQFSELTFNPVAGNLALMLNATSVLVFEGYTAVGQLNQGDFSFPAAGPALGSLGSVGNPILSDNDDRFITSDPGANIADAGAGEDVLITGPGNDVLIGGADGDRLQGGAGDDELRGGPGPD